MPIFGFGVPCIYLRVEERWRPIDFTNVDKSDDQRYKERQKPGTMGVKKNLSQNVNSSVNNIEQIVDSLSVQSV